MRIRCALFTVLVFLLTFSTLSLPAASFPGPGGNPETSMIGFGVSLSEEVSGEAIKGRIGVELTGPKPVRFKVDDEEWTVVWVKVEPGTYVLAGSGDLTLTRGLPDRVEVPPGTIILAPFLLERDAEGVRTTYSSGRPLWTSPSPAASTGF